MLGRSALDRRTTGRRQADERAAGVGRALSAFHQATLHHAAELVGQPALLPVDHPGQVAGAQLVVGRLGQRHQQLVVGSGQSRVSPQVLAQHLGQPVLHLGVPAPGALLALVQPPG
jgi:hypothetical protein